MKFSIPFSALGLALASQVTQAQKLSTTDCLNIVETSITKRGLYSNSDFSASVAGEQISITCHNYYVFRITENLAKQVNAKSKLANQPCQFILSSKNSITPDFLDELSKELFGE
jgi:hypothetical protein